MSEPQRANLVEQLFHEALDIDPAHRAEFLTKACEGDMVLLAEVTSLLASYERGGDFLQRPAFKLSASDVAGEVLGEDDGPLLAAPRIKGYRLLREVGRGGMGAVYLAVRADDNSQKRVAIKVVKRGMDTDFILRRFEREQRILAALNHPYIARLLDGGATDEGQPFFVMEYVEGRALDRYVKEEALNTPERLRLFLKICEAVSYAHGHRVIHRDLKPSNILVTPGGIPKLLDFGVAKLLDIDSRGRSVDVTATAYRVMTPEYASPEQLRGLPPAEASDVYSLGVLLYILLTGTHPYRFRSRAPDEILRSIVEGRVRRPSQVSKDSSSAAGATADTPHGGLGGVRRELRGNLDKVVMKALRREPGRRYASAEQLSDDIRRYLDGLPVKARGDSLAYRAAHIAGRRPASSLLTALVAILCLAVGFYLGLFGARAKSRTTIAVMPFAVSGDDAYSEQLAEGITDGLAGHLSRLPQVFVPSHNSVYIYKGRQLDPQKAGRELGVEALLVGSLAVEDQNLHVSVELVDAITGKTIWQRTYTARSFEVMALQRQITADLIQELGVTPSAEELRHSAHEYTQDEEAYRLYVMGRYFFNKRKKMDFYRAIEYFRRATEKDPSYALAYAGLADCYGLLGAYLVMDAHEAFSSARAAANKALELDEGLAEARATLALVHWLYDWDWAAADREFRRAIELKPRYVIAHHWRGLFLGEMGRFDEAFAEMQRALELDPVSAPVYADYGRVLYWARRYDEAQEKYEKVEEMGGDFGALSVESEQLYEKMGRADKWVASVKRYEEFDAELQNAYRAHGIPGYWRVRYRRESGKSGGALSAELCARVGDKEGAFASLELAIKARDHRVTQIKVNPLLDPLRSDPRFKELLRRMNLTP